MHKKLQKDFKKILRDVFAIELSIKLMIIINKLSAVISSFYYLIEHLQIKGRILFYIQDLDFMFNGYVANECCKKKNIISISIDHSILLASKLFINRTSDYYFVWGEYQKKRLNDVSGIESSRIRIIGNPGKSFYFKSFTKQKTKSWLYLVSGFNYSINQNIFRSPISTQNNLHRLNMILSGLNSDCKLLVKLHPLDKYYLNPYKEAISVKKLGTKELSNIEIIFFEDTSAVIDFIEYPIHLIYIADQSGSKNIFNFKDCFDCLYFDDDWKSKIKTILANRFIKKEREKIYNYFYQDGKETDKLLNCYLSDIMFKNINNKL